MWESGEPLLPEKNQILLEHITPISQVTTSTPFTRQPSLYEENAVVTCSVDAGSSGVILILPTMVLVAGLW